MKEYYTIYHIVDLYDPKNITFHDNYEGVSFEELLSYCKSNYTRTWKNKYAGYLIERTVECVKEKIFEKTVVHWSEIVTKEKKIINEAAKELYDKGLIHKSKKPKFVNLPAGWNPEPWNQAAAINQFINVEQQQQVFNAGVQLHAPQLNHPAAQQNIPGVQIGQAMVEEPDGHIHAAEFAGMQNPFNF